MANVPKRGFPVCEFDARLKRTQQLMATKSLAGILLMSEAEVRYLSGFHTQFWQS
ncbi:MAG TPA: peptidase M24, partial [Deltaproteobacteria bacterium]|nr:peptidase M24 [Deltaproteobacteria bacterium]